MTAAQSRAFYQSVGITDTIPLAGKLPIAAAWQTSSPDQQWRRVTKPEAANIGLRHGAGLVTIDADNKANPATFDHVMAGLVGLGVTDPPIVRTASGIGRHVYLNVTGLPDGMASRNLSRDIGAGELRFGVGALSVLPWSIVGGATYTPVAGDWHHIPAVEWFDLLWLLPLQRVVTQDETLPIRLNWRPVTPGVKSLWNEVAKAGRGDAVGKYPSRSEGEAAIVMTLILNGWTFDDLRREFERRSCGHYHDAKRYRVKYLANTCGNVLATIMSSPIRLSLAVDYRAAESTAWPGRTGNGNRATFLAILAECYRVGAIEADVSVREVAEYAAIAIGTAHKALKRLASEGLIERVRGASEDGALASVWKLAHVEKRTKVTVLKSVHASTPPGSEARDAELTSVHFSTPPEIASRQALGPSAVAVYQRLDVMQGKTAARLARETGRARSTVAQALKKLQHHKLAAWTPDGWIAGTSSLEDVAANFGCGERAAARRAKHIEQRARYQEWRRRLKERREAMA